MASTSPCDLVDAVSARCDAYAQHDPAVWIHRLYPGKLRAAAERATEHPEPAPLRGMSFAIKDNIDLAGVPTTAACPGYAYTPRESAAVVEKKLVSGGAMPIGKTNLDQFATGLVGTRSPYGAPRNVFNADYLSGGSSSGSAVAVAAGLVDFALGTDTAGSGRVPAAFNGLVGLKPTRGLLLPLSRLRVDPADPFSRLAPTGGRGADLPRRVWSQKVARRVSSRECVWITMVMPHVLAVSIAWRAMDRNVHRARASLTFVVGTSSRARTKRNVPGAHSTSRGRG